MHFKKGSRICCSGNISGKVQWGTVWNLKYSQFKRKEGLCSQGVRAGEPSGAGLGRAEVGSGGGSGREGAWGGRISGQS